MHEQKSVVIDEAFSPFREQFDESLKKSLNIHGINLNKKLYITDVIYMNRFIMGELKYTELIEVIEAFGEKTVIVNLFNGNRYEFEGYKQSLRSINKDMEKAKNYEGGKYVSEQVGKELLNSEESTQLRTHSLHFNKGLGDNAGFVSMNYHGYVWQLFADGFLQDIDLIGAQKLVFERYGTILTDDEAMIVAKDLNKNRRTFEGKILQGNIGDSKTTKDAISIITNAGKKKGMNFERTNILGLEARRACQKFEHEAGRIIGQSKVVENTSELNSKTARMLVNLIESTNQDAINIVAIMKKILRI